MTGREQRLALSLLREAMRWCQEPGWKFQAHRLITRTWRDIPVTLPRRLEMHGRID